MNRLLGIRISSVWDREISARPSQAVVLLRMGIAGFKSGSKFPANAEHLPGLLHRGSPQQAERQFRCLRRLGTGGAFARDGRGFYLSPSGLMTCDPLVYEYRLVEKTGTRIEIGNPAEPDRAIAIDRTGLKRNRRGSLQLCE